MNEFWAPTVMTYSTANLQLIQLFGKYIYIFGLRHAFAVPTMLDPTQQSPSSSVRTLQKFSEVFVLITEAALSECCPRLV